MKIATLTFLLALSTTFAFDMPLSMKAKEVVKLDLWYNGVSENSGTNIKNYEKTEELAIALDKLEK